MKREPKTETVVASPLQQRMEWWPTGDAVTPWESDVAGETWTVGINDFPEGHLYTVFRNGVAVEDFDDWPSQWIQNPVGKPKQGLVAMSARTALKTKNRRHNR